MVESGQALAVMGNHQFDAIPYVMRRDEQGHLLPRNEKNTRQHQVFLDDYPVDSPAHREAFACLRNLSLWLDLGDQQVIYACRDRSLMGMVTVCRAWSVRGGR
jgi:hypothetical protein